MNTSSKSPAQRAAWRRGSAIGATLFLTASATFALGGPVAAADGSDQPSVAGEWDQKDSSVDTPPAVLAAAVDSNDKARVVSVREEDGHPVLDIIPVTGNAAAQSAVSKEQAQDETLAVVVEEKQKFVLGNVQAATSNDPFRSSQWALDKLRAEKAWGVSRGAGQTVAVVDTGVAPAGLAPDLSGRVLSGHDFVNGTNGQYDPAGHGTHVSGIIAAKANNRVGVAGLAPDARILPVRVLDENGSGWTSDIANGINWATNHGAGVINLSLGGSASPVMESAINYAVSQGRVVVAAAGNGGSSVVSYPAGYSNVISVGATNSNDAVTGFSSFGPHLDVAAPGLGIYSTVPGGYASYSGTSMATPYVSATVALLRSAAVSKSLGAVNVKRAMESTAVDIDVAGHDVHSGAGRINPYAALCSIGACGPGRITPQTSLGLSGSTLTVRLTPGPNQVVTLQRRSATWQPIANRITNGNGVAQFKLRRGVTYRIAVPGTTRSAPTVSVAVRSR